MLEVAGYRKNHQTDKPVYKQLVKCLIGQETIEESKLAANSFDIAVSSACMIKGHFPNNCFDTFLNYLKLNGQMVFSIREKYLNSETDSGMNYHGALH